MPKPGRQSKAELSTVANIPVHLESPVDLTPEQQEIWGDAVRSMEVGFFKPEHRPSLEAYCRHVSRERELSHLLQGIDPMEDQANYKMVRDWVDKESAKILAHMRSLRLTPQSQYDEKKASRSSKSGRIAPWQTKTN